MTDHETRLVDLMTARAQDAPDDLGLLSRVQAASARRTRVRRYGALGAALATVAGVALGASVLTDGKPAADRFADPTGFLVDGRGRVAQFPLTPTYLHPRLSDQVSLNPLDAEGVYGSATWQFPKVAGTGAPQDMVTVLPSAPKEFPGATSVTVNGVPGRQSGDCGALTCTITWERDPQQVVQVYVLAASGGAKEEAYRVAGGLVDRPIVVRQALVLGLVPDGDCVLQMPRGFRDGTAATSYNGDSRCRVGAVLEAVDTGPARPAGEAVVLGVRSGTLRETSITETRNGVPTMLPFWSVSFPVGDDRVLEVTVPRDSGWTRKALDRFVGAIELPKG